MLTSCSCCHAFPAWSSILPPGWTFSHLSCELKWTLFPPFVLVGVFLSQPQKSSRYTGETRMLHCIYWGKTRMVTLYPWGWKSKAQMATLYPWGKKKEAADGYIVSIGEHGWLHCIHKCKFARPWSHRWPWLSSANHKPK